MSLNQLIALLTFVAVGSGSPGPNNTLLLASGVTFGFRRTVPHVVGTSVGIALLVGVAATGAGVVVTAVPGVKVVLKIIASAYLVYLAARLAGGVALDPATMPEPFSVARAALFQFVNPKGWIFALALVSAFAPASGSGILVGITVLTVSMVVAATAALWALGGTTLSRALEGDRARRAAGVALGALLLASVAFLWV
jgi:threonine/homoserine/homoserine lactone efflux protein